MINKILKYLLISILFSCTPQEDKEAKVYYVVKHPKGFVLLDSNKSKNTPPPLPLFPPLFYGHHNFILKDTSIIFYYKLNYDSLYLWCGTGVDENHPPQINLSSEKIKSIPINELSNFLNKIIPDSIQDMRDIIASISYPTDTIKNRAFKIITNHFKQKGVRVYNVRNLTGDENSAIKALQK